MIISSYEPRLSSGRISKSAILLLSSLFALGTVACSSDSDGDPQGGQGGQVEPGPDAGGDDANVAPALARIEVTPGEASVKERRTVQLSAKGFDEDDAELEGIEFTWASSDEKLATVDSDGLVTSLRPGEVNITVSASGKSAEATITITESTAVSLELQADTTDVPIDGKVPLHAVVKDDEDFELLGRNIAFESADESIAIVEDSAAIGIDLGETKITAKLGALEDSIDLRVVHRFTKLFAGPSNTCGLTALGRAWCWGNGIGLGDGSEPPSNATAPVRVAMEPGISFQTLALGVSFGCGLTTDEKVHCWGTNEDLVLGREDKSWSSVPLLLDDRSYKAISASPYSVCGLDDGGFAHCWGGNSGDFELGNPDVTESSATPVPVSAPAGKTSPVAFTELRHGMYFSCGLTPGSKLYCWGYNNDFRLGDGTEESRANAVAPLGDQVVKRFDLGKGFACAITADEGFRALEAGAPPPAEETTHCWGENMSGQAIFGAGSPVIETPTVRFQTSEFVPASLALGNSHACALDADGRAFCWGSNAYSQLGRSTAATTADIGEVLGGRRFKQLVSGGYHACGLAKDGKTYCWGFNGSGQLGKGDLEDAEEPTAVVGQ